jgi:hypothetical protein
MLITLLLGVLAVGALTVSVTALPGPPERNAPSPHSDRP